MITCGTIKGGYGHNIVADQVEIVGTTRSFTRDAQETIKSRMSCICCGVAQTYGGEIDLCYEGETTYTCGHCCLSCMPSTDFIH